MLMNRTSKLAAAVALNILADALDSRSTQPEPRGAQPLVSGAALPLGFIEYSRSEIVNQPADFSIGGKVRDTLAPIERALPYDNDMHLKVLKQLLREIDDNARSDKWSAIALCTGVMCLPGQLRECVKVVYVLNDGTSRSATWFKQ